MTPAEGFAHLTEEDVDRVASRAWQNVSAHSLAYSPLAVLETFAAFGALGEPDLAYRAVVQFLLTDEVRRLLPSCRSVLARMAQTTKVEAYRGRGVLGHVDWPSTVVGRTRGDGDGSSFVLLHSETHRDLPENRLAKYTLSAVLDCAQRVLARQMPAGTGWVRQVDDLARGLTGCLASPLLISIPAERSRSGYLAARASRSPGYRDVAQAFDLYDRLFGRGDAETAMALFRRYVLLPQKEDRVFELRVLFELVEWLAQASGCEPQLRLLGLGAGPCFTFSLADKTVDVYYQGVPPFLSERSLYASFTASAGLRSGARRPDIVVWSRSETGGERLVVFECKCSTSSLYLSEGIFQLLGYHSDFQLRDGGDTVLALVAFGGVVGAPVGPLPIVGAPFAGYATDLAGLPAALDALGIC